MTLVSDHPLLKYLIIYNNILSSYKQCLVLFAIATNMFITIFKYLDHRIIFVNIMSVIKEYLLESHR
jgi:hypothetical protein